ncbi:MAG: type II toxin-antitoxin system VapC family toxin [Paludibacter sp.]|nr:type II toxin-antitoxin system VapC family toxin [Paludibacter sp.]
MEQPNYLIDTNAVIDYLGRKLSDHGMTFMNTVIDEIPNLSIITKIEVLGFNTTANQYQILTDFMDDASVYELTEEVADVCIALRKKHKTKLPDAIIAATALVSGFILITRNVSDFKNIKGLTVLNPYSV